MVVKHTMHGLSGQATSLDACLAMFQSLIPLTAALPLVYLVEDCQDLEPDQTSLIRLSCNHKAMSHIARLFSVKGRSDSPVRYLSEAA